MVASRVSLADQRVALLRGINVGTAKRIAMADLRRLVEALGYEDVRTVLNSGNVVFSVSSARSADPGPRIEEAIKKQLGIATRVTVVSGKELSEAVRKNPLRSLADNPSRLLIMVFSDPKAVAALLPLIERSWKPDALALGKRVAYLWCANGILDSRMRIEVDRLVGEAATARNVATMERLLTLVEGS